jgi:hypothetical protein
MMKNSNLKRLISFIKIIIIKTKAGFKLRNNTYKFMKKVLRNLRKKYSKTVLRNRTYLIGYCKDYKKLNRECSLT